MVSRSSAQIAHAVYLMDLNNPYFLLKSADSGSVIVFHLRQRPAAESRAVATLPDFEPISSSSLPTVMHEG